MIRRQIYSISCRSYCSVSNLSNDIQNAKPFSEMPTFSFHKAIIYSLPGGKYYKKPLNQCSQMVKEEYGNILRISAMLRRPQYVITFNPDDFEKVNFLKFKYLILQNSQNSQNFQIRSCS